ncbi:hypothetical protein PMI42_01034 [Bradyrhizobium sp. YR681]|uniref:hypothetical protein n=1 Tax=Bradyrhizobium sp. YR681 TaxID=1144344 RepID=UPI00027122B2|nr:hypothetical protein [Bradyrhizobium sp. YR681]EJN15428.1 hypothetical protein PMI42_01034 [Bradyrhizobium sp. YR681]
MRRVSSAAASSAALALLLAGCASSANLPPVYHPPRSPSAKAVQEGVKKAAAEVKLTGRLETTAVRPTNHGPGSYFVCLRLGGGPSDKHPAYSVFFDDDAYKGIQSSVIFDACEVQPWVPFN